MNIAIVQDHLRLGGTESQSVALANAFADAGHAAMLLVFRPGGPLHERLDPRVLSRSLQRRDRHLDWFAPGLVRTLRGFQPSAVLLMGRMAHVHGWRLPSALPQSRIVATVRTGKSLPWLFRLTLARAHTVVANSHAAAARLAAIPGIAPRRLHVVHNGIVPRPPAPPGSRAAVRSAIGTPADAVVFLCAAMMRPGKGHRDLVAATAGLVLDRPWELWLAGNGSEMRPCLDLARRGRIEDRVRFLGTRDDVPRLLAGADIAMLASRPGIESLPNFLVEAQWEGLPAVATDVDGVRETMIPGQSGLLVRPADAEALRDAMRDLARDPGLRGRFSEAARAHARAAFDPARQSRRYLEILQGG
jgi:glycosyltransferase involved in cell wall biosynthesis